MWLCDRMCSLSIWVPLISVSLGVVQGREECSVTVWKRDIWFRRDNGGLGTVEMHGAEQLSKDTSGDICAHPSLELGAAGALTALWIFDWFWFEEAAWDGGITEASDFLQWAV